MKITIAAANGLIGTYLSESLSRAGHEITQLVRRPTPSPFRQLLWNPYAGEIDTAAIDGQDVIINLAGKNVAADRWSDRVKTEIIRSRVLSTGLIAGSIAKSTHRPQLLLNASAVGYYGNCPPSESVTEDNSSGSGFMAESCLLWEEATKAAEVSGVRVAMLRMGVVLSGSGGALEQMLPFFKLGLGGKIASGAQMMSWISLAEIGPIVDHILSVPSLNGGINVTSPFPVSNHEFTRALAKALHRPAVFWVPGFALQLAFGEMAKEVLIGGAGVIPQKLTRSGYQFRYTNLEETLAEILR